MAFLRRAASWLRRRAENVLAALLGVMFAAFMIQIVARYLFNFPIGWTIELTVVTWLWLVLWGAAFVAKESEEIRIDLVTSMVGRRARIALGIIVSVATIVLFLISLPATISYVTLHEGGEDGVPQDPVQLALLDLPRCSSWRSSCATCGCCRVCCAARTRRRSIPPRWLRRYERSTPFAIAIGTIVALSMFGLPVGHAMIGGSVLYLLLAGLDIGTAAEQLLNGMYSSFLLLAIPLFILAAEFMSSGAIMERLLRFCNALVGRFRGGMAQVNVLQSVVFSAMSGSALADAASSGKIMQQLMTRDGRYPPAFAAALTAASAVMGPVIPPSIPLVVFALVSDTSIGFLLIAGIIPGILIGVSQMTLIALVARRRNFPVEAADSAARIAAHHVGSLSGAADAGHPSGLPVQRRDHAHRSGRGGRRCMRLLVSAFLYRTMSWRDDVQVAALQRARHDVDRHADRRRDGAATT